MSLSLKGYVLEPPRVGGSNSAFTSTPNDVIADLGAFQGHYPVGSEPVPRTEYLVLVRSDGDFGGTVRFGWTKNENVARFDYQGQDQRFYPLPGLPPQIVGTVGPTLNASRLKVIPPTGVYADAPFRLSLGPLPGTAMLVSLVTAFGAPGVGQVEILLSTGELNWNPADLVTYAGQDVRFQRQSYATFQESTGRLGVVEQELLLCPLPATGQYPLVRLGYGAWLVPVEKANDGALDPAGVIPAGTFQWSLSTGLLRFSQADQLANAGTAVFQEGVLMVGEVGLPTQALGTVALPAVIASLPAAGGDLIFRLGTGYRFPQVRRISLATPFDAGAQGEVQVREDGVVKFSDVDIAVYGATPVTFVSGDFPLERGIVFRFFRNLINLDGQTSGQKDVANLYEVQGATWADPIIASPQVFLPAVPRDDLPTVVRVEQGTGSFTGVLPRVDTPSPPAGLGYYLDFGARQFVFAQRKNNEVLSSDELSANLFLPDPLVLTSNLLLEQETGLGTGVYVPLTLGEGALVDPTSGQVTFTTRVGAEVARGVGALVANTLTDGAATFLADVAAGDYVVVQTGPLAVYRVQSVDSDTQLTLDVPVVAGSGAYSVRRGPEVVADRYWQEAVLVDPYLEVERITPLGPAVNETVVQVYPALDFPDGVTVQGPGDFGTDGVVPGDTLVLTSGVDSGTARIIVAVDGPRLTVDRAVTGFATASGQVVRRLRLPPGQRVRLGAVFVTPVVVATDAVFGSPPAGTVEVSAETGNLNFALADVGGVVYRGTLLTPVREYRINAALGFVELSQRLLAGEEVRVTYRPVGSAGLPLASVTEYAGFLVAKELTDPTPRPNLTDRVFFNPTGRSVQASPAPAVFRGGRPQAPAQVAITLNPSEVKFLPAAGFQTNALPSGSAVQVDERIYVDYYVREAFGGERSFTVSQTPMFAATVVLTEGASSFMVVGDQTAIFPSGYLLRVEGGALYRLAGSSYDIPSGITTVTLMAGETFAEDVVGPLLEVTSGQIPLVTVGLVDSYFVPEPSGWTSAPRGARTLEIQGDRTSAYRAGVVVLFAGAVQDFYGVTGVAFDATSGRTTVTLASPLVREISMASGALKVSTRAIVEATQETFQTQRLPLVSEGYSLVRRVEGQPGQLESATLNEAGFLKVDAPLAPLEGLFLFYTGMRLVAPGVRLRASYTAMTTPSQSNGLVGQRLKADFTLGNPDTFFGRVETLTNFRGEVAEEMQAKALAQAPSAGPVTSNATEPRLYEQGRPSLFYDEGHLANVDYVARALLKFYHDQVDHLEDVQQSVDGRVVGATDGRFRFDGEVNNPVRLVYADVTNEIDDQFQVSPYPTTVTWVPPAAPVVTYLGTNLPLWQPSAMSRLYPMQRKTLFGLTTAGLNTGAVTGEAILDFAQRQIQSTPPVVYRRWPRGQVLRPAYAGDTTLYLDNAQGMAEGLRPAFAPGMVVVVSAPDGTPVVGDGTPLTVTSVAGGPERIGVSGLPVDVPVGSTVFLCVTGASADTSYQKNYRLGTDVNLNGEEGHLLYVRPYFPFDGSVPLIPAELLIQAPNSGEFLQMDGAGVAATDQEPLRFPALDGAVTTDTGDTGLPLVGPVEEQERRALDREASLLVGMAGAVVPAVLTALAVDGTGTVLTNTTGPWPLPAPQLYDLVRFLTGPNAAFGWRRINGLLGPNVATVDAPFPSFLSTGTAIVAAAPNVATGTATFPSATVLDDPALSVLIQPGMTVVCTTGLNQGVRRQVVRRLSATQLLLDAAIPNLVLTGYRVHNPLNTWSALPVDELSVQLGALVTNDHHLLPQVVDSQYLAVERFFEGDTLDGKEGVLTVQVGPAAGTVSGTTLTDGGQDFVASGVTTASYVYITSGGNRGFRKVVSVAPTALTVATAFPFGPAPASYRVVTAFGVGQEGLEDLFGVYTAALEAGAQANLWQGQLTPASVTVSPADPFLFATDVTAAQLSARQAVVVARQAVLADPVQGPLARVGRVVGSRDKLYDNRYAWVSARTSVSDGTLYEITRAVVQRQQAQAKLVLRLTQLASVQGAP